MGVQGRRLRRLAARLRDQSGNGPITAVGGVLMFLFFLFMTVQAALHLYANSQAGAIAVEAASRVAHQSMTCAQSETWAVARVPGWPDVQAECTIAGGRAEVRLSADSPAPALRIMGNVMRMDTIVRTGSVRVEQFQ